VFVIVGVGVNVGVGVDPLGRTNTQSEGSEFGTVDGYEHTSSNVAAPPTFSN
jgi:hypothetical protein